MRSRIRIRPLFGVETESSFLLWDEAGRVPKEREIALVQQALASELGGRALPFQRKYGGWALANGARVYYDDLCLTDGGAFEYSTAEHTSPFRLARDVAAGHQLWAQVAERLTAKGIRVEVYGSGPCYKTGNSTGTHLNYYRQGSLPARELAGFLASAPALFGSGGFATSPGPSPLFVCSPRVNQIHVLESSDSTWKRGLIDTYNLTRGESRIQDLTADNRSLRQLATRVGSMGLLLGLVDGPSDVRTRIESLRPIDPLAALHRWNRDPHALVALRTGVLTTAAGLQQMLCDVASAEHARGCWRFPGWTRGLLHDWQTLITAVRTQNIPAGLLDWHDLKAKLMAVCEQHSVAWSALAACHDAPSQAVPERDFILRELMPRLHVLATRWQRIWPGLVQVDGIGSPVDGRPPRSTRGRLRGEFVRANSGRAGYSATWDCLRTPAQRAMLINPFESRHAVWTESL